MVILNDARSQFYQEIAGKRALVFVFPDVDGLCAWKILRELFVSRQILYTLLVVADKQELRNLYTSNKEFFTDVVLINCGANFDLVEALEPNQATIFYVCDSHRPIHVNNFYNQRQVKLICLSEDTSDVPKFEDIFQQFSTDEESDGDSETENPKRTNADAIEKRIEKRKWLRKKQDILMDYTSYSYYTVASSVVLFDLAWRLSQENVCLLWFAIVGQTSQLLTHCINREHYIDQLDYLQSHVSRLGHAAGTHVLSQSNSIVEESKAKIEVTFDDDLTLWLYKHWSLKETLETSMLTAAKFKLFTEGGQKKLLEFLVHLGLPRRECLQRYSAMTSTVRDSLNSLFLQYGEKYGLNRRELFLPTFTVQLGYRTPVSAMDAVFLAITALELHGDGESDRTFQRALDTLSCWSLDSLDTDLSRTQSHLQSLASQVRNLLDTEEVVAFGPFLYLYLRKSSLVSAAVRNNLSLSILTRYVLMVKASVRPKLGRDRRTSQMPLIMCVDSRTDDENVILLGIPPLHGDDDRNLFGQAFEAAVNRTKSKAEFKYFDSNCIELHREDMLKLFEALSSLLS